MARRGKRKLSEAATDPQPITNGTRNDDDAIEPPAKRTQTRREVFVRNLASTVTSDALVDHFSESYPIKRGFVVTDPSTNQCKGYGFVTFADSDDAAQAVTKFQNSALAGRKIKLEVAEPRHRDVDDTLPAEVAAASGRNRSVLAPEAVAAKEKRKAQLDAEKNKNVAPRLIVRNLPWSVKDEKDLERLFLSFGKVKQVILPKTGPGRLKGFGFVLLRGRKNAEKAVQDMNGKEIDGRQVAVDFAVDKDTWAAQAQKAEIVGEEKQDSPALNGDEGAIDSDDAEDEDALDGSDISEAEGGGAVDGATGEATADGHQSGDDDEEEEDEDLEGESEDAAQAETSPNTLFVRNLPFSTTDDQLRSQFSQFGPLRYARTVLDAQTERPRGTGFVYFYKPDDAKACLKNAPKNALAQNTQTGSNALPTGQSVLQDDNADPLGKYTLDGRVLQLARAVGKSQAAHLADAGRVAHEQRMKDKRRLYLLNEGTISTKSALYESLTPAEKGIREASFKQRKALIQSNPSLHVSLTRLSVRNIPRTITSKSLKELARQAVVGFATDVKQGKRERLSKEELNRGGDEMYQAEKQRKLRKSGIVKQAKVVFETVQGSKADEKEGGGRSRGYGFIEYYTHRSALMGLRYLNGHAVGYTAKEPATKGKSLSREDLQDRKKRLIVEFAIDNAQVVHRRADREDKARERAQEPATGANGTAPVEKVEKGAKPTLPAESSEKAEAPDKDLEKLKRRQQTIARKRAKRRGKIGP